MNIAKPQRSTHTVRHVLCFVFWLLATTHMGCRTWNVPKGNNSLVSARQLSLRGADALQRSRDQDAELLFSQALTMSKMDERAHWGYATTLWNRGDKLRATEHMSEAVRLSGRNPEYAVRLGEMNLDMGQRALAKQYALEVLSANRNNAQAWALLGDTHRSENDFQTALECYHRALLIRNDYPSVQLSVAELYRVTGRPQRSLACLDRMTDLRAQSANDAEHLLIRGMAFADLNRPVEAASALAKCSDRLPVDHLQKQLQLVETQQRIGELVSARISLGRLLNSHSHNAEVQRIKSQLDSSFVNMATREPPSFPPSVNDSRAREVDGLPPSTTGNLIATPNGTAESGVLR